MYTCSDSAMPLLHCLCKCACLHLLVSFLAQCRFFDASCHLLWHKYVGVLLGEKHSLQQLCSNMGDGLLSKSIFRDYGAFLFTSK